MQGTLPYFIPKKLTQKQWEQLFLSLYKNMKQKKTFDIQYEFLHLSQPALTCLKEIGLKM